MPRARQKPFFFTFNTEGMDESKGTFFIQPSAAELISNMYRSKQGQFSSHNFGNTNLTAQLESGADIDSLGYFRSASGTDYLLCVVNGKLLHINTDTGAITTTVYTGLTAGYPVDFQTFKGAVYLASETITPRTWTGTGSTSAVTAIPLTSGSDIFDKPKIVDKHHNRLVYANFNGTTKYPSHILLSDDLDPDVFDLAGSAATDGSLIQVSPGDGQAITALRSLFSPQQNESFLVIFKERSIYILQGYAKSEFQVVQLNDTYGCVNNRAVVQMGSDLLFLGETDIYSLTAATSSGNVQPSAVGSEKIRSYLEDFNLAHKDKAWAIHIPWKQQVWFGIPTGANTEVDTILVYQYSSTPDVPAVWSIKQSVNVKCGVIIPNTFYGGNTGGYVQTWLDSAEHSGAGYSWQYRLPYTNFGDQTRNKRVVELAAYLFLRGTTNITITTRWRGGGNDTVTTRTLSGVAPGTGVYGVDTWGAFSYGSGEGSLVKIPTVCRGNGEQLQVEISGTNDDVGVDFLGLAGLVEFLEPSRRYN